MMMRDRQPSNHTLRLLYKHGISYCPDDIDAKILTDSPLETTGMP